MEQTTRFITRDGQQGGRPRTTWIHISDSEYQAAHGKAARGRRQWAFSVHYVFTDSHRRTGYSRIRTRNYHSAPDSTLTDAVRGVKRDVKIAAENYLKRQLHLRFNPWGESPSALDMIQIAVVNGTIAS